MKTIRILKWIIYIILFGSALIDPESRQIMMLCFFAFASLCSGIDITRKKYD